MGSKRAANVALGLVTGLLATLALQSFLSPASSQIVVLGVIAGLLAVLVLEPLRQPQSGAIEYKILPVGALDQATLDHAGKEGWQLVCIDSTAANCVFKR